MEPVPEGRWPRGVTPHPRSGQQPKVPDCYGAGTAERSYPVSEVGGGGQPRGDTQRLKSGAVAGRSYPMPLSPRPGAGKTPSCTFLVGRMGGGLRPAQGEEVKEVQVG